MLPSMLTLNKPNPAGRAAAVPLAIDDDEFSDKFYCDFNLNLSKLSDDELTLHDCLAQYSASAFNANLYLLEQIRNPDERTINKIERMRHAKSIYAAYRSKINVERALRKRDRPYSKPIEHYFMIAAKKLLPEHIYLELMESAKAHSPYYQAGMYASHFL
jgi:hypothetical protein